MTDFVEYVRFDTPKEITVPHSPNQGKWIVQSKEHHLCIDDLWGGYGTFVYLNVNGKPTFYNEPDGHDLVYFDDYWKAAEALYKYLEQESDELITTAIQNDQVKSRPLFDD